MKIGVADNAQRRLASLQTASPEELELYGLVGAPFGLERTLHTILAPDRLRGEWFTRTPVVDGLVHVLQRCMLAEEIEWV